MGALVSALAFPVPDRRYSLPILQKEERRENVVWLSIQRRPHKRIQIVPQQVPDLLEFPALYYKEYPGALTLLYSHGNAEDIGILAPYLRQLANRLRVNLLAYEYPGYSSGGTQRDQPSEELCYHACHAAFNYLTENLGIPSNRLVLVGRSLGPGPTVDLASRQQNIAGTILQSPLESGIRCVMGSGSCSSIALSMLDIFPSYAKIQSISGPVFILHGQEDRVVPCSNGKALYHLLQERPDHVEYPPQWIPQRGHNDIPHELTFKLYGDFLAFVDNQ